jgi:serine phosphatase RsbU (regulator of sigma subunit)
MKRSAVIIILILTLCDLQAQLNKYGVPIMKSYSTKITPGSEFNWWITKDKFGAVYFGNDDKGVIRYDGSSWSSIPVRNNSRVRALGTDKNGIVYVGGAFEFGFIEPDIDGKLVYVSLSKRYDISTGELDNKSENRTAGAVAKSSGVFIGEIFSLAVHDSLVFYLSNEALFVYNINNQELVNMNLREQGFSQFVRIFSVYDKVILAENNKGLFEYQAGKIIKLAGGEFFGGKQCLSVLPVSEGKLLVGTYNSGIFLYDYIEGNVNDKWVDKSVSRKISPVYCGAKLATGEFVLGTVGGEGIFVLDRNGQLVSQWNNKTTDLQDNIIYALYTEPDNNELWIATAGFISKAFTNIPFTQFSAKAGIDVTVNGICELNGIIYISTDNGAYRSQIDVNGSRYFVRVEGINDQVFPIVKAKTGKEEFILAGSILGLYKIPEGGKAMRIEDKMIFENEKDRAPWNVRCILQSKIYPNRFFIGTESNGVKIIEYQNANWKYIRNIKKLQGSISYQVECDNGDLIVMTDYPNALLKIKANDTIPLGYGSDKGVPGTSLNCLGRINEEIVISSGKGLYKYKADSDTWISCDELSGGYSTGKDVSNLYQDVENGIWLEFNDNRYYTMVFFREDGQIVSYKDPLLLLPNVKILGIKSIEDRIWLAKSKSVFVIDKSILPLTSPKPSTLFTKIRAGGDSLIMNGTFFATLENGRRIPGSTNLRGKIPEIKHNLNSVSFYWTTPFFIEEESLQYSYKLEGFTEIWSKWEPIHYKDFTNLPYGKYTFRVKAKTITDIESKEAVFQFSILKPWYFTTLMIILYAVVIIFVIFAIIRAYTQKLKNENIRLEGIVAERTAVVVKQKEELESSIYYARRIQMALLPSESILAENIRNYFILLKPRDIVSGDFYWMTRKDNRLYVVASDCTGHGVPGAFMSLLGMSFLDEIIDKETLPRADFILSELRLHVTESLKQVGGDDEAKDGMDISLLVFDFNKSRVEFSGAYNPCFRVRKLTDEETRNYNDDNVERADGSMSDGNYLLETIHASKMPIGISAKMNEKFEFSDWSLEKGISYYLFSDGYIDQFGGPKGRKFMKKNFKRLILKIQDYPMKRQKEILENNLNDWMGKSPQVDDILVMGLKTGD